MYARYLWNNLAVRGITTVDIDFGFSGKKTKAHAVKTIYILEYVDSHELRRNIQKAICIK